MALSIDQKRLKATKFPPEFDRKVDIEKVNIDLMKKWIAQRITDILGDEDDIVVETCYNLVEQNQFVSACMRLEVQQLLTIAAQNQGDPDPAHWLPQQGYSKLLQGAMGPDAQRPGQPNGCSQGNARGKEGRITARAGRAAQITFQMTWLTCTSQLSKAAAESRQKEQADQDDIVNMFREADRPRERNDRNDHGRGRGGRGGFRGERGERGDRGGYRGDRGGRGGRDFDRRPPRRDSRSPPP